MSKNGDVNQFQREERARLIGSIQNGLTLVGEWNERKGSVGDAYIASGGEVEELEDLITALENKPFLDLVMMSANVSAIVEYEFYQDRS